MNHLANVTIEELRNEDIDFNNEQRQWEDAFDISLSFNPQIGRGRDFFLFINGQLSASFTTLGNLNRRANEIIEAHNLERVL